MRWPFVWRSSYENMIRRAETAESDWQTAETHLADMRQERVDLLKELELAHADLALAYQTRDDAMLEIGRQKMDYEAQLKDRGERVAELQTRLAQLEPAYADVLQKYEQAQARLDTLDPPRKNHAQTPPGAPETPAALPGDSAAALTGKSAPISRRRATKAAATGSEAAR